jgi:hypothetical protein
MNPVNQTVFACKSISFHPDVGDQIIPQLKCKKVQMIPQF